MLSPADRRKEVVSGVSTVRPLVENLLTALSRHTGRSERGQTLTEYGLVLVFIVLVVFIAVQLLGPTVSGWYTSMNDEIP